MARNIFFWPKFRGDFYFLGPSFWSEAPFFSKYPLTAGYFFTKPGYSGIFFAELRSKNSTRSEAPQERKLASVEDT
jgi:hypothetical protein